jgi:hypothetical protein
MKWLKEFIHQSFDGNLKTSQYPREFGPYKMKVSFGQGMPARIPWISFFASGMSTSNGYYPVYLHYKDQNKLILAFGISETNEYEKSWNEEVIGNSQKIKDSVENPPRYGESWVFKSYDVVQKDGSYAICKDGSELQEAALQSDLEEILGLFSKNLDDSIYEVNSPISAGLFYMEKQLEDFIIDNWNSSELGKTLDLIFEEGELVSQQYRTEIGPIDILAREKGSGTYVVIELKRNQTSDDTVGQVLRYMGWVAENLSDPNVKGIIIAGKYDKKLHYAQSLTPNIDVFLYEVNFSLKEHSG